MMTTDQIKELEELASALMPLEHVATILGVSFDQLCIELENENSEAYRAYNKGKLMTIVANNTKVINLAKQGSSPAELMVKKMELDLTLMQIQHGYK